MTRGRFNARGKLGQSLIETCLAMLMVCLVFTGIYQVARLFAAKEILDYSAGRAARAKTVGFNHWMVLKAGKVGAIPNAGAIVQPAYTNEDAGLRAMVDTLLPGELWDWTVSNGIPVSEQYELERARIPEFLESANDETAYFTLDYSDWDSVAVSVSTLAGPTGSILHGVAAQVYPLTVPMHRAFYDEDEVDMRGETYLEKHYSLYLEDLDW